YSYLTIHPHRKEFRFNPLTLQRYPNSSFLLPTSSFLDSQLVRAKSSILFHSSALSWSFAAAMFSSRCASDDVPGIAQHCSFSATPLLRNECKRHASERVLRSLSFGFGHL